MTVSDRKADSGPPMQRFVIGDEWVQRAGQAGVENAVRRTAADWNVIAVGLPGSHTIETLVWGVLTESERRLLEDVIGRASADREQVSDAC